MLGNHDDGKACAALVQKIDLFRVFDHEESDRTAFVATHMPKRLVDNRLEINVHGHVHLGDIDDPRYVNICVERTDYRPLHIDELRTRVSAAEAQAIAVMGATPL